MSHAFVKEEDGQWLHDIAPTMPALLNYLSRENNGITIYEKSNHTDPLTGKEIYTMSNGLAYTIGPEGKWEMVE